MQVDGEPWRQPIPAAPEARRRRPAGLQESGPSVAGPAPSAPSAASAAAADGSGDGGELQRVVVRVSYAGRSTMLLNCEEPQGIRRARNLAARGAKASKPLKSRYSFLDRTVPTAP